MHDYGGVELKAHKLSADSSVVEHLLAKERVEFESLHPLLRISPLIAF